MSGISIESMEKNIWNTLPPSLISKRVWLPLEVTCESVNEVIYNLTLNEDIFCLPFRLAESRKIFGLICVTDKQWTFKTSEVIRENLYSKVIENSDLTIGLLNIWLCKKDKTFNTPMERYLSNLFASAGIEELVNHLQTSIPIAFAHNFVAKKTTENLDALIAKEDNEAEHENVYTFVAAERLEPELMEESDSPNAAATPKACRYDFLYVTENGDLVYVEELALKTLKDFGEIIRLKFCTNIFAIVDNELGRLRRETESLTKKLAELDPTRPGGFFGDESLTEKDLMELSELSEEIDSAEDYELFIQSANDDDEQLNSSAASSTWKSESAPAAVRNTNEKPARQLEARLRELATRIASTRKTLNDSTIAEYTQRAIERFSADLYASRDYGQFSRFYRHNVLENSLTTPKKSGGKRVSWREPESELRRISPRTRIAPTPRRKRRAMRNHEEEDEEEEERDEAIEVDSEQKQMNDEDSSSIANETANEDVNQMGDDADELESENVPPSPPFPPPSSQASQTTPPFDPEKKKRRRRTTRSLLANLSKKQPQDDQDQD